MSSKKINRVITRFPNLECGFFDGLLEYFVQVRRRLGITTGKINWEFISTAMEVEYPDGDPQTVSFNTGGGRWDQHGKKANESLCQMCSLDFVREEYDFTKHRPWLRKVFELVRDNDVRGTRISRHKYNLRELMTALSFKYSDNPELVLNWLSLAFCGIFENCRDDVNIKKVFDPEIMKDGVALFFAMRAVEDLVNFDNTDTQKAVEKIDWFEKITNEAIATLNQHWNWAQKAVAKAEELGKTRSVFVPALNKQIKVIEIFCDSFKTGAAARAKDYQVVIQRNKSGHVQVHGGFIKEEDGENIIKKWIHMGWVAKELRFHESRFRNTKIADRDWTISGVVYDIQGNKIPWYLPEFLTSLYNGTMSSRDVPPTKIGKRKLFNIVCSALGSVQCGIIVQKNNNTKQVV